MTRATLFKTLFCACAVAAAASPVLSQQARAPGLPALSAMERGMWEFREPGSKAAPRRICVSDPVALMQIRHGTAPCSRYVIDSEAKRATVHYTCPGAGHGRTTLRVETSQLIQLESQGIAEGAPFNFSYEGRKVGACR